MHLTNEIKKTQQHIENLLKKYLPPLEENCSPLHAAMHYSVLGGGKRIRPLLVYGAGNALGAPNSILDTLACAIEFIHCYSMIHDDLPAMDDDDLRRGKPTCHQQFDEATAILAGDALQCLAFEILAIPPLDYPHPEKQLRFITTLAKAAGASGMVEGQMQDIIHTGKSTTLVTLTRIHQLKTSQLLEASVSLGIIAGTESDPTLIQDLRDFARCLGLAFQIKDDILDIESSTDILGKPQFADIDQNKATYPQVAGLEKAKQTLQELITNSLNYLNKLGDRGDSLRQITQYIVNRNY